MKSPPDRDHVSYDLSSKKHEVVNVAEFNWKISLEQNHFPGVLNSFQIAGMFSASTVYLPSSLKGFVSFSF